MLETHAIRLGTHAEKDYLLRASNWFDEVILNANLVQAAPASLGVFLMELRDKKKTYFVDPVTYAYALSPHLLMRKGSMQTSRANLKRTFQSLAPRYGEVVDKHAGERALEPGDFVADADKREFCRCVLDYQKERINEGLQESAYFIKSELAPVAPAKLVAPYFHLSGETAWLELNSELASIACQMEPTAWVAVCLDSFLLFSQEAVDALVETYKKLETPGYLVWASDFIEERANVVQIQGLRSLVNGLSQDGKRKVVNMFGGYFSCLLAEYGLTGVSHGLGYGERRDIEPVVGGGIPPAKYYLPAIHKDIRMDQFVAIAQTLDVSSFQEEVCNCVICAGLLRHGMDALIQQYTESTVKISNNRYREVATPRVRRLTRFHYLSNKNLEFGRVREVQHAILLDELDDAYERFSDELGSPSVAYLRTWRRALSPSPQGGST